MKFTEQVLVDSTQQISSSKQAGRNTHTGVETKVSIMHQFYALCKKNAWK
jgi:hypothetical protein